MCALGLMGKLLTSPWMTKFYVPPGQGLDYMSVIQVVKDVLSALVEGSWNPLSLFKQKRDFFGSYIEDPVSDSIINFCPITDEMIETLAFCLNAVISVIDRTRLYQRVFTKLTQKKSWVCLDLQTRKLLMPHFVSFLQNCVLAKIRLLSSSAKSLLMFKTSC